MFRPALGTTRFVYDPSALERVLSSRNGSVARMLVRKCIRVESQAKLNASGRPGPNVRTGRLRSSITWAIVTEGATGVGQTRIYGRVGSAVYYAGYVERGTSRSRAYPYLLPALSAAKG